MKITGIIAEYNPFHNGHKYHIEQSKKITNSEYCIVVMSGNYVQRGEPAITDKWTRTKMALQNGADIVIELPCVYATSSAESFAFGAVSLLNSTNIVSSMCFGSETNDIESIKNLANILCNEPYEYQNILKQELKKGLVFPVARANALKLFTGNECVSSPNNILAVEYIKALLKLNSNIQPFTIKRQIAEYHSTDILENIASATAIRLALKNNNKELLSKVIPKDSLDTFLKSIEEGIAPIFFDNFSALLHYKLRTNQSELSDILDITEGIENRIINYAKTNFNISDIVSEVKTKRYTYTKIQRALLHIILDIKKDDLKPCNYLRVLGFRKSSEHLLSKLYHNSFIPVITNLKNSNKLLLKDALNMLNKDIISTDIYYLNNPNLKQRKPNREYTTPIIIVT